MQRSTQRANKAYRNFFLAGSSNVTFVTLKVTKVTLKIRQERSTSLKMFLKLSVECRMGFFLRSMS